VTTTCPACGSSASRDYFLRESVPIHQHRLHATAAEARGAERARLDLACCDACSVVWNRAFRPQLLRYVPGYDNDASGSERFRRHLEERVDSMIASGVRQRSVLEIGCGQGEFLRRLCRRGDNHGLGFDPAFDGSAAEAGNAVELRRKAVLPGERLPSADVVVCRHLIEHVAEPLGLIETLTLALEGGRDGSLYVETPSLEWIVEHHAFWDFFYEHCTYFTEPALRAVLGRAGLEIVELSRVFDGQYWWAKAKRCAAPSEPIRMAEPAGIRDFPIRQARALAAWAERVERLRADRPVVVWGAGAKGTTFVQLVDLEAETIEALVDVHPGKQSRYVPATGHRVEAPEWLSAGPARVALVMNPAYEPEIRDWLERHCPAVAVEGTGSA